MADIIMDRENANNSAKYTVHPCATTWRVSRPGAIWQGSPVVLYSAMEPHTSEVAIVHGARSGVSGHGHGAREAEQKKGRALTWFLIPLVPASSESCWELWVHHTRETSNQSLHFRSEASELGACQDFSLSRAVSHSSSSSLPRFSQTKY